MSFRRPPVDDLVSLLRVRAEQAPAALAFRFLIDGERDEQLLTYGELDEQARRIAGSLRGAPRGERIVLMFPPGLEFIAAYFGCLYAGHIAVPTYPPDPSRLTRSLPRLIGIVEDSGARLALTTGALLGLAGSVCAGHPGLRGLRWVASDAVPASAADEFRPVDIAADDLAFLQYTSGSTGDPKGVQVSHRNLLANEEMIRCAFGLDPDDHVVGWLPLYHDMGLIGNVLQPIYLGARCTLLSPLAFLGRPLRWLAAVSRFQGTVSGAPNFAYDLCVRKISPAERAELDLGSWRVAYNGAEPVDAATLHRFATAFAGSGFRATSFVPCYGLAEATLIVASRPAGAAPRSGWFDRAALERAGRAVNGSTVELVGCGAAAGDQTWVIVDPELGTPRPDDEVGEIWVRGPHVAGGYWQREDESREVFHARLHGSDAPHLRTGDLGFRRDGELYVTGRSKDLLIFAGRNLYPQDVERTVEAVDPALRPGCGAVFSVEVEGVERLVAVHEISSRASLDTAELGRAIRRAIAEDHEVDPLAVVLIRQGTLPKTSSGKIQRRAARRQFLDGTLDVVSTADRVVAPAAGAPLDWLLGEIARRCGIPPAELTADTPLAPLGIGSLTALAIAHGLEDRHGLAISPVWLLDGSTASSVVARATTSQRSAAGAAHAATFPQTASQQAMWFTHKTDPSGAVLNLGLAVDVRGALDPVRLQAAWRGLFARYPGLRSRFHAQGTQLVQTLGPPGDAPLREVDAAGWAEHRLDAAIAAELASGFDLERDRLVRATVFRCGGERAALVLVAHHLVVDFWSLETLWSAFTARYADPAGGDPAPGPTMAGHVAAEAQRLAGGDVGALIAYWRDQLGDERSPLELPWRPTRTDDANHAGHHRLRLDRATRDALKAVAAREGVTLYTLLVAAYQAALRHATHQDAITIGSPFSGRLAPDDRALVGCLINMLPLRMRFAGRPTLRELLHRARAMVLGALAHAAYPSHLLAGTLRGRTPLFEASFVFEGSSAPGASPLPAVALGEPGHRLPWPLLDVRTRACVPAASALDLTLTMAEIDGEIAGLWLYRTAALAPEVVARLDAAFRRMLEAFTGDLDAPLAAVRLLADDQRALTETWATGPRSAAAPPVHELFARQVLATPDAIAVISGAGSIRYAELHRRSLAVAATLVGHGIGAEDRVGVCLQRTPDLFVAMLGVLAAGATYVPLDVDYPPDRLALLANDAAMRLVLVDRERPAALTAPGVARIALRDAETSGAGTPVAPPAVQPAQLAYLMYTSGSTGTPRGVMVSHAALSNFTVAAAAHYRLRPSDRSLQFASTSWDTSVEEIFPALVSGGSVVLRTADMMASVSDFLAACEAHGLTILNLPTSFFRLIVGELGPGRALAGTVRIVIVGGEPVLAGDVAAWHAVAPPEVELINTFGLTEATAVSAWGPLRASAAEVSLGRPVDNVTLHVLDADLEPVAPGARGTLHVGGAGLARGYWNDAAATADRFVPSPFGGPGARLFCTGDQVRWLPDGTLAHCGRDDHQLKLRGMRIEPGEIESALRAHPGVRAAAVALRGTAADARLVGYVVPRTGELDPEPLRAHLAARLPGYMVPSDWVGLDGLPVSPNGKLDRRRLPEPPRASGARFVAPDGPIEQRLAALWSALLARDRIGRDDDFFALGGHSLLALQLIARVREQLAIEARVGDVFDHPTLRALAARLQRARPAAPSPLPGRMPRAPTEPVSPGQRRLWYLDQLDPGDPSYNLCAAVRLTGPLQRAALERSLADLVARHESLRTRFASVAGEPVQIIDPALALELAWHDAGQLAAVDAEVEARSHATAEAQHRFDLETGPLIRARVVRLADDDHVLVLNLHHIVSDGWSMGVVTRELSELYSAHVAGRPPGLPPLALQYADLARWQPPDDVEAAALAYWTRTLANAPPLQLPTDRTRPAIKHSRGAERDQVLPAPLAAAARRLGRDHGCTLFMTVLAALEVVLGRTASQTDLVIGTAVVNRPRVELEGLIGFFVNTLVLRTDLSGDPPFAELLTRLRRTVLEAHDHAAAPFERVVEALNPERDPGRTALFQVMVLEQPDVLSGHRFEGLRVAPFRFERGTTSFDLSVTLTDTGDSVSLDWQFSTDLFDDDTVARLQDRFLIVLAAACGRPTTRLHALPMVPDTERALQLETWNQTGAPLPDRTVVEMLDDVVRRRPDAIAAVSGDRSLTYGELDAHASRLAHHLIARGVGPEVRVAVCLERGLAAHVAMLAVLKAGGVYVPLDPAAPAARLALQAADAGVVLAIVEPTRAAPVGLALDALLTVDLEGAADRPSTSPARRVNAANLAYVLYTTGSTGRPKGVMISHGALANRMLWARDSLGLGGDDVILQVASPGFDVAIADAITTWACGGRLALTSAEFRDPQYLEQVIRAQRVTFMDVVPSLLHALLAAGALARCPSLAHVFCGGEAVTRDLAERFAAQSRARLYNIYGPTETCVECVGWPCERGETGPVPIGRPMRNVRAYVLDDRLDLVPIGVPGELHIAGPGLARGYLGDPGLTAARFVPSPFRPGARLYRTGDRVRYRADGALEFLGRSDQQVKLRGVRIELEEVNAVLANHPSIAQSVVVVRPDPGGDPQLVGYVVPRDPRFSAGAVRRFLKERLPIAMVPARLAPLAALPLNASGKIDQAALPEPGPPGDDDAAAYVAPRDDLERELATLWSELLGVRRVGVHDDFFDLGGHSLRATQLLARLRSRYAADLKLIDLFAARTVAELARLLGDRRCAPGRPIAVDALAATRDPTSEDVDTMSEAALDELLRRLDAGEGE